VLFDLGTLRLTAGEGRRLETLGASLDALEFGGQRYEPPATVAVTLSVDRMVGAGYALRLRMSAPLRGACMRCLEPAEVEVAVDAREVDQRNAESEDLDSPYVDGDVVDIDAWVRDALVLALPAQVLCRPDCAGLCPVCGADLNEAGPDHAHEPEPDPRWAKLRELKLD